jgi:hypothetical protein
MLDMREGVLLCHVPVVYQKPNEERGIHAGDQRPASMRYLHTEQNAAGQ